MDKTLEKRGTWGSRAGFTLAAVGCAVGLGNIWKFPYMTGENGGGWFVLIYLAFIALVGLPIMIAELAIGRWAQSAPVAAFGRVASERSTRFNGQYRYATRAWKLVGAMAVVAGFSILTFYAVVGGWTASYLWSALFDSMAADPHQIKTQFRELSGGVVGQSVGHGFFMLSCVVVVAFGIRRGIELASDLLMPALFLMMLVLLFLAARLEGFSEGIAFVFTPGSNKVSASGILEALGHSFFTLSLGSGAMLTYGSYLAAKDDIVAASGAVSLIDTAVALVACAIMFPVVFTFGLPTDSGAGFLFDTMPVAFAQMEGGRIFAVAFFALLWVAALTSGISLLEVVVATVRDVVDVSRGCVAVVAGLVLWAMGLLCILSLAGYIQWDAFGFFDGLTSRYLLPLGGLGISVCVGWFASPEIMRDQFCAGSRFNKLFPLWVFLLRYPIPIAILVVFLHQAGLF